MNPRLESSKKWSSLPSELLEQISSIFNENFAKNLDGAKIKSEGRIYQEELLLRIGFIKPNEIKQTNFEASLSYDKKKENVLSLIHLAVDCIGSMFENYINDNTTEFPLDWAPYKMDKKDVFLQYSSDNSELEKKADQILELQDDNLVQDNQTDDINPEDLKQKLGLKD